jgi:hypothetical protein
LNYASNRAISPLVLLQENGPRQRPTRNDKPETVLELRLQVARLAAIAAVVHPIHAQPYVMLPLAQAAVPLADALVFRQGANATYELFGHALKFTSVPAIHK